MPLIYGTAIRGVVGTCFDAAEGCLPFVKTVDRDVFDGEITFQRQRLRLLSVDLAGTPADIRGRWNQCIQDQSFTAYS